MLESISHATPHGRMHQHASRRMAMGDSFNTACLGLITSSTPIARTTLHCNHGAGAVFVAGVGGGTPSVFSSTDAIQRSGGASDEVVVATAWCRCARHHNSVQNLVADTILLAVPDGVAGAIHMTRIPRFT